MRFVDWEIPEFLIIAFVTHKDPSPVRHLLFCHFSTFSHHSLVCLFCRHEHESAAK